MPVSFLKGSKPRIPLGPTPPNPKRPLRAAVLVWLQLVVILWLGGQGLLDRLKLPFASVQIGRSPKWVGPQIRGSLNVSMEIAASPNLLASLCFGLLNQPQKGHPQETHTHTKLSQGEEHVP